MNRREKIFFGTAALLFTGTITAGATMGISINREAQHRAAVEIIRREIRDAMGIEGLEPGTACRTENEEISAIGRAYGAAVEDLLFASPQAYQNPGSIQLRQGKAKKVPGRDEYVACAVARVAKEENVSPNGDQTPTLHMRLHPPHR